jgi:DNA-binding IclR family transcriptional regulator
MHSRDAKRQESEEAALKAIAHAEGWMTAKEIAMRLNRPKDWYSIARALQRLVERGLIEADTTRFKDYRQGEDSTTYRMPGVARGIFISWQQPQVPKFVQVTVRTVRLLKD